MMWSMRARAVAALAGLVLAGVSPVSAQWVRVVVQGSSGVPIAAATVTVQRESDRAVLASGTSTREAVVVLGPFEPATVIVRAGAVGRTAVQRMVSLVMGDTTQVTLMLGEAAQDLGIITVVAERGEPVPDQRADRAAITARAPHDAAEVLREIPGTDAMRRGGTALDPVVRGLRDTQVGVYVDAARTLPGGPAGMDTPMSHVDPSQIREIQVLTGPYALTWGAGNLSAIRVSTTALPEEWADVFGGRLTTGYDENLGASEVAATLEGALGTSRPVRYVVGGAWREGGDYTDGDGRVVQSGFASREARARLGMRVGQRGTLSALGSFQAQRDIDYPGRPLDAEFFDTYQLQAEYAWRRPILSTTGSLRLTAVDAMAYVYDVDHRMDNDEKPTALPDPTRMPPFATNIETWSGVRVLGGRVASRWRAGTTWDVEFGGDVVDALHDAARLVDRRDNGAPVRRDLIWGGALIRDVGGFVRVGRALGTTQLTASARVDVVRADADTVSPFFAGLYGTDVSSAETNWSGAVTLRVPLGATWSLTSGIGSVVRTAEANEKFSDRAAAKRAQTNAEFVGNPALRPERSTQGDLWLQGDIGRVSVQVNAFARRLSDYITIAPTTLPKAQPGSPNTVYRFINGTANYAGGEVALATRLADRWVASGTLAYLWGEDVTLDEPALGVTPLRSDVRLRYDPMGAWFVEAAAHLSGAQDRVATVRGERPTEAWTTMDLQAGVTLWRESARPVQFRAGVRNLFDAAYVQHLSALNAFGGGRLFEPGRVLFVRATAAF